MSGQDQVQEVNQNWWRVDAMQGSASSASTDMMPIIGADLMPVIAIVESDAIRVQDRQVAANASMTHGLS